MVSPTARRLALGVLLKKNFSLRLSSKVVGLSRNAAKYTPKDPCPRLRQEVIRLSEENPSFGYRRIHALLGGVNLKSVHRIWKEEGLSQRVRKVKRILVGEVPPLVIERPNQVWSIDFCTERLENGRHVRILAILDAHTRECLCLKPAGSFRGYDLKKELDWLFLVRGKPEVLRSDNGPEFRSKVVEEFLQSQGVAQGFIKPGSPWQNGHIESFFGKLRFEVLNRELFPKLKDLERRLCEAIDSYNNLRPHSALGNIPPSKFAAGYRESGRTSSSLLPYNPTKNILKEVSI